MHRYANQRLTTHINILISTAAMFLRSLLHSSPNAAALPCSGGHGCPDILEMESGDFAVIGTDITATARPHLPQGSRCGTEERIIRLPRAILAATKTQLLSAI